MPRTSRHGEGFVYIFAVEVGGDQRFTGYTVIRTTKKMDTVRKVCASRGKMNLVEDVLSLNSISSGYKHLKKNTGLIVPGSFRSELSFGVLAGDEGPRVVSGYAMIDIVPRSERAGLSVFTGYEPIVMEVPIRFEAEERGGSFTDAPGDDIERDIQILESMAGRGAFSGAAQGAPPRISVTTPMGNKHSNLIPINYQFDEKLNKNAPIWWISGISWDDGAIRNAKGDRVRQLATVTLTQFVRPDTLGTVSAAERAKVNAEKGTAKTDPDRPNVATGTGQVKPR